jgi:Tfp pilus assembly protein PilX
MTMKTERTRDAQAGFALILAILALMLLTFLGLTLATTTSSELQIATNYRWSQQAYYNAEAGIEAGKLILRGIPQDWSTVLPTARAPWPATNPAPPCGSAPCTAPTAGTRNWEGVDCDTRNGTGYGAVLLGNENVTQFSGTPINGAFTLWVKRDVIATGNNLQDEGNNSVLILTAEGVAPQPATVGGASLQAARAVRVLQVKLFYGAVTRGCQAAEGQTGTTAGGSNFGACAPLDNGSIDQALGGGGGSRADSGVK